jgi:hypothetical protein
LTMTFGWTAQAQRRQYSAMALGALLLAMIAPLSSAEASGVSAVEVGERQITIRFDDVVEKASSFVLSGPDRIAIDVIGSEPGAPASPSGIVNSVRQGRPDPNTARIVFDLAEPALISGGQLPPTVGRSRSRSIPLRRTNSMQALRQRASCISLHLPTAQSHRAAATTSPYRLTPPNQDCPARRFTAPPDVRSW